MAIGDAALAAGMKLVAGAAMANTLDTEVNQTRDYIAERTAEVAAIEKGGTGATTAAGARANLGVQDTVDQVGAASPNALEGQLARFGTEGRINIGTPISPGHGANKSYVDGRIADVDKGVPASGGTFTGSVYHPNASAATSGYVVAYLNSDGRLSRGASSARYKKNITEIDPADLGNIWPQLVTYQMIDGDDAWHVGHIAETLADDTDQEPFVVYGALPGEHIPESIDFIALLLAQTAQTHADLVAIRADFDILATGMDILAQRLDALEGR